jgi:AcrR family transcriptional regulator
MATTTRRARKPRLNREEQKAERTQQLLDAAWAMYGEKGYERVTIDDVAEHAGYSRMPVYSLFGDKQNLYFELWRKFLGELSGFMLAPMKTGGSLRKNLEILAKQVTSPRADPNAPAPEGLFFIVQTIALSRPEIGKKLNEVSNKVLQDFAQMIRTSTLEPGEVLRASPEIVAAHLIAHINGLSTVEFQTQHRYGRTRDISDIFLAIAIKSATE